MEFSGIVVNRLLTKLAELSEQAILQRVASVAQIRTRSVTISLFISSAKRLKKLQELHKAVWTEQVTSSLAGFGMSPSWVPFLRATHALARMVENPFLGRNRSTGSELDGRVIRGELSA